MHLGLPVTSSRHPERKKQTRRVVRKHNPTLLATMAFAQLCRCSMAAANSPSAAHLIRDCVENHGNGAGWTGHDIDKLLRPMANQLLEQPNGLSETMQKLVGKQKGNRACDISKMCASASSAERLNTCHTHFKLAQKVMSKTTRGSQGETRTDCVMLTGNDNAVQDTFCRFAFCSTPGTSLISAGGSGEQSSLTASGPRMRALHIVRWKVFIEVR